MTFMQASVASLQVSVVHPRPSLQLGVVRVHVPSGLHRSSMVQNKPSSQGALSRGAQTVGVPAALHRWHSSAGLSALSE